MHIGSNAMDRDSQSSIASLILNLEMSHDRYSIGCQIACDGSRHGVILAERRCKLQPGDQAQMDHCIPLKVY